jgi:3-oxoacyl-[acyl-carrier-protein] synthase II
MSAFAVTMMIPNMAAGYVSIQLGLKGPLSTVCTACASGANAVGDAFEVIRRGAATAMFAGGTEASVDAITFRGFCAIRALSTRNDSPTEASRPFDLARDGFVVSEGAAILVLEELEHARRRGAEILAEIVGYGMSADALNVVQPDPSGAPQARALSLALAEAGLTPDEVEYVNAHGTSTPLGDIAETRALTMVLGDHAARTPVSSTKSMIGHMLGAAGAIEAAFAVLAIKHGIVPPTINLRHPDPECTLDYVPNAARYQTIGTAVSTSFAFGGHNVALAFKACSQ